MNNKRKDRMKLKKNKQITRLNVQSEIISLTFIIYSFARMNVRYPKIHNSFYFWYLLVLNNTSQHICCYYRRDCLEFSFRKNSFIFFIMYSTIQLKFIFTELRPFEKFDIHYASTMRKFCIDIFYFVFL